MISFEGEKMNYLNEYNKWCDKAIQDKEIVKELQSMSGDMKKIEDAFYCNLAFGTGGLRGIIGAGTNRINVYTIARASQGLADYINNQFPFDKHSIAISYDSRINSELFSKVAAGVFAANGIKSYIYPELMPTPCLSYAVRSLKCAAGVMITASHNPSKYNGYKVYGDDGCQITTKAAEDILNSIEKLDYFGDIKFIDFEEGLANNSIAYISEEVYSSFIEDVKKQSTLSAKEKGTINKNVAIVYTPLNGTGLKPVTRILKESGYTNVTIVKEQEKPDGNFPTCPYPNPEIKEAMTLGIEYAKKYNADLLLATDPDCDRVGIAVKNFEGEYTLLSGNETGILLLDYICSRRIGNGTMPDDPTMIKTIVTTDLGEQIADYYGVKTKNVLTGFKYIGEQIGILEKCNKIDSYIFGFEESYGYLSGSYVRDKDAVNGAFLICEMFAYYSTQGIGLLEKLNQIYEKFGFCLNTLHSFEFEGHAGFTKMRNIMEKFREGICGLGNKKIVRFLDYATGIEDLPKSDVLKFFLEDGSSVVVRPSGTEPKLKAYISVSAKNRTEAEVQEKMILDNLKKYFC